MSWRTRGEPSMAPKRKESLPKSACCTSETRVFLHEDDQLWRSSTDGCPWTNLGKLRARWIRARRRMRLTPERMAKARVPAPEMKRHSAQKSGRSRVLGRTKTSTKTVL